MNMSRPFAERRTRSTGSLGSVTTNPPSPRLDDKLPQRSTRYIQSNPKLDIPMDFPLHQIASILDTDTLLTQNFRNEWVSEYTAETIHTLDVHANPDADFLLVHELHPVIFLLAANSHLLGAHISEFPRVEDHYVPVDFDTFHRCCNAIIRESDTIPRMKFWLMQGSIRPPNTRAPLARTRSSACTVS